MAPVKNWSEINGEFIQNRDFECIGDVSNPLDLQELDAWDVSHKNPACWEGMNTVGDIRKLAPQVRTYLQQAAQYQPATLRFGHQHIIDGRLAGWCIGYDYDADLDDEC